MKKIEGHNVEYKSTWRDEYLEWISGFANAHGGSIFIGIDDNGRPIEGENIKKLSEDLPNKIRDILGVVVDVFIRHSDGVNYLEIEVPRYDFAVSYRGHYYYRSGSTKKELNGASLTHFLLKKSGKRWDAIVENSVKIADLSISAFDLYLKKAVEKGRVSGNIGSLSVSQKLEKLHLLENGKITRAAILVFHPDPEIYVSGAYIKIGAFSDEGTLMYHDEIHGPIIEQIDRAYNLLVTKYASYEIQYHGVQRKEIAAFPEKILREALVNSIVHKNYAEALPIQIKVYSNKIVFWNPGELPESWTVQDLKREHISKPFNEKIANVLYKSGDIEAWGQGTLDIIANAISQFGVPPIFSNRLSGFMLTVFRSEDDFFRASEFDDRQIKVLKEVQRLGRISNKEIQVLLNISKATATRVLQELSEEMLVLKGIGAGAHYSFK